MQAQQNKQIQQFDQLQADVTLFVKPVMTIAVTDQDGAQNATTVGKQVKSYLKKVEDLKKALTKPLNDEVKRIRDYADKIALPLENAEQHIKKELVKWERHLENVRREELARAEAERKRQEEEARAKLEQEKEANAIAEMFGSADATELAKSNLVAEAEAERAVTEIRKEHKEALKEVGGMKVSNTRRPWVFEVEDESKLPREYLMKNDKALRAAVVAGTREIPGVRIYQDVRVAL
jgi:hypothetical protein